MKIKKHEAELRKDIVSDEWVLVAAGRAARPHQFRKERKQTLPKKDPFLDPQSERIMPILWLPNPKKSKKDPDFKKDWWTQIIPNKYPALREHNHKCPVAYKHGPYSKMDAIGFHEIIITRDPKRTIADMTVNETDVLLETYLRRYKELQNKPCIEYILIFHNQGPSAGASIAHPHSQLMALPIIPPDVYRSLGGARRYYLKHKKCAHCRMLEWDRKDKKRIVYENSHFTVVCPFASHVSFETRIYPKKHSAYFERMDDTQRKDLADALKKTMRKLKKATNFSDYNFFFHTAPTKAGHMNHYHWHLEILPRISKLGGVELGTGMEVVVILPEEAAEAMRKAK